MGRYTLVIEKIAKRDLQRIYKSGKKADIAKIEQILFELTIHPTIGTGKPEKLKYDMQGQWSRRINQKDRIIYKIVEDKIQVVIVSARGHYT